MPYPVLAAAAASCISAIDAVVVAPTHPSAARPLGGASGEARWEPQPEVPDVVMGAYGEGMERHDRSDGSGGSSGLDGLDEASANQMDRPTCAEHLFSATAAAAAAAAAAAPKKATRREAMPPPDPAAGPIWKVEQSAAVDDFFNRNERPFRGLVHPSCVAEAYGAVEREAAALVAAVAADLPPGSELIHDHINSALYFRKV